MPNDITYYNPNSIENTMADGIGNSCWRSRMNLARRYAHIDIKQTINAICYHLKRCYPQDLNPRNKYMTAARCMYPDFGAVGLNRQHDFATVAYYWAAANDESITNSTVQERLNAFIKALCECQRNPDLTVTGFELPPNIIVDRIVCPRGVYDKLAECFTLLHPDTTSTDVQNKALELARGFIAELYYAHGGSYTSLVGESPQLSLEQPLQDGIKAKIKLIMQAANEYDDNVQRYIDGVFAALEDLGFCNHSGRAYSSDQINDLIAYATREYNTAMNNNLPATAATHTPASLTEEDLRVIKSNIRQIIPAQNNVGTIDHTLHLRYMNSQPAQAQPAPVQRNPVVPLWTPTAWPTYTPAFRTRTIAEIPTQQQINQRVDAHLESLGI